MLCQLKTTSDSQTNILLVDSKKGKEVKINSIWAESLEKDKHSLWLKNNSISRKNLKRTTIIKWSNNSTNHKYTLEMKEGKASSRRFNKLIMHWTNQSQSNL
jgi:hypothetical protein